MAVQPGGYTDNIQDDNTPRAHPAYNRGKARGILETLSIIKDINPTMSYGKVDILRRFSLYKL